MIRSDLLEIILWLISVKTIVLKWQGSFRYDEMPFLSIWLIHFLFDMTEDFKPSCQPRNDNNITVIKNWKCIAQESHKKMKIISKFERYFFAQKESHFERIISRKKALETFIISKRESIFIDFVLLIIRKRESSLNLMYYENISFRGLLGACFVLLSAFLIHYQ